jgi:hypothetical protein
MADIGHPELTHIRQTLALRIERASTREEAVNAKIQSAGGP